MKKKIFVSLLFLVFAFNICLVLGYADEGISVTLNDEALTFDIQPQIIDNRTMVPLRKIFEAMGAVVDWNNDTQTVVAKKDDETVVAAINSKSVTINGEQKELDVPPLLIDGRTLVPIRFVAESFGATVEWDDNTKTVVIHTSDSGKSKAETIIQIPDKEYSHFGIKYKVPSEWDEPVVEDDYVYYYPIDGIMMIQRQDSTIGKFGETEMKQILNGMSKGIKDYQLLSTNKEVLSNDSLEAYSAEFTGIISNRSVIAKMLFVQTNDYINVFCYANFNIDSKDMRQFDAIMKTITLDTQNESASEKKASKKNKKSSHNLTSKSDIESYLCQNYPSVQTDMGEWEFTYTVIENEYIYMPYDYTIWVKYDLGQMNDLQYSNKLTSAQRDKVKKQLKSFMKDMAEDLISELPDKKLEGSYHYSYYKYPTLKLDLKVYEYCSWKNYSDDRTFEEMVDINFDRYGNAKITDFHWSQEYDEEQW